MSKQDDLLFCKIALQAGMVSESDAKRCLAYAQKLENAGKPRPRIGTVFVKANLMTQQQVSQVLQAARKRGAKSAPRSRAGAAGGRRGARRGGRGSRAEAAPSVRKRALPRRGANRARVPQGVLWLYIGSGVAFVLLVIWMVYLFVTVGNRPQTRDTESGVASANESGNQNPDLVAALSGDGAQGSGDGTGAQRTASKDSERYRSFKDEQNQVLLDAGANFRDERFGLATSVLNRFMERNAQNYNSLWPDEKQIVQDKLAEIEGKIEAEWNRLLEEIASEEKGTQLQDLEDFKFKVQGDEEWTAKVQAKIDEVQGA